jgi:AcrR family transcriptional regulator
MRKTQTKDNIMLNAFKLFLKKGFTDVSINEIVKNAGTTKGGFFHYFESKDHLYREIIETYLVSCFEIASHSILDTNETLYGKLKAYFDFIPNSDKVMLIMINDPNISYRSLYLLIMEALKKYDYFIDQYKEIFQRIYQLIKEQLAKGLQNKEIAKNVDIDAVAYQIITLYEGMLRLWVINPEMFSKKENDRIIEQLWNSIRA